MTSWLEIVADKAAQSGALVRAVIIRADGSTPREAGAAMLVTAEGIEGTIGGGALELEAIGAARKMMWDLHLSEGERPECIAVRMRGSALAGPVATCPRPSPLPMGEGVSGHEGCTPKASWWRETRDFPLGPSLGQCCGGFAKVLFELFTEAEVGMLRQLASHKAETGLVVRPVASGLPPMALAHRKEGYGDLPINALRVTRDMLSGARPVSAAFIPGTRGASAWFIEPLSRARTPLYLYGAGHVGRALIRVLEDLPFEVTWVDTDEGRFPIREAGKVAWAGTETRPPHPNLLPKGRRDDSLSPWGEGRGEGVFLTQIASRDPAAVAASAPAGAFHLVMTYSHPLDLAICHAILKCGTSRFVGLIGSQTKRVRFVKRLRELGHDEPAIGHLICPIGIPGLPGKEPATIAVSVAAQLLQVAASVKGAKGLSGASEAAQ